MTLDHDELARYARHIVLHEIGGSGQLRLKRASVALVGVGGIGSPAIQYLAAAGVGRLILIDDDRVEASNLQRQTIFRTADVGMPKVTAAARAAAEINPHVVIEQRPMRLDDRNAAKLLADAAVVIDGSDSFATRLTVADAALAARIPLVSAAVGQFDGQLAVYRGWEADKPCYRCLVGNSPAREGTSCAEDGVLGPMVGMMGSLAALEAIRAITRFGADSAGLLLIADLLNFRFRSVRLQKDPACRCTITTP
ncbi:MAG: HesA/MoeB/ThiF family protein [Candidatus Sphingomonas colombiensis]|nr:HesA/MoeB/ThiF family protein [Sphingomonas sp.]WEK42273.1 MAG: HesA/MoeB/ThiF family protein [Sphingomonas sp.]